MPEELAASLKNIKKICRERSRPFPTEIPICVGFGISTPEQVKEVQKLADGAIVGSAIIKIIEKNIGKKDLVKKVGNFVKTLKGGG